MIECENYFMEAHSFQEAFSKSTLIEISTKRMESVIYTILALLVAVNNVEAIKTFDCEIWKEEYVNQPNIYNMIKCGDTGTIMNEIGPHLVIHLYM